MLSEGQDAVRKIVINNCHGGFSLSGKARQLMGWGDEVYDHEGKVSRDDLRLVHVVEELGDDSWGNAAELVIVEIPDDVEWIIQEYDGVEWVAEKHRTWPEPRIGTGEWDEPTDGRLWAF